MKRTLHPPAADVKQKIYKISNKSTSPTTNSQGKLVGWAQKSPGIRGYRGACYLAANQDGFGVEG
jgi:hypothetical protein